MIEAFARLCYGLVGTDAHTNEAGVSIRHVGELWDRAYSVGAELRSSRSDHLKVGPRLQNRVCNGSIYALKTAPDVWDAWGPNEALSPRVK